MSEQLKPCPFCGSEAEFKVSQGLFWIGCGGVPKCLAMSGMLLANRDMAIAAWNTRVHYSELTSANARAEKAEKERDCWKRGCHKAQDDGDALRNLLTHSTDVAKEHAAAFMALKKSRNSADDECTRLSLALLDAEKERDALKRKADAQAKLIDAFTQKRNVDGMCGRTWDACEHFKHEKTVTELLAEARKETKCKHCLNPIDDCECSDFDVNPDMGDQ